MKFQLKGNIELSRKLERIARRSPNVFAEAAFEEMEIEAQEVRNRTPVDTGNLVETVRLGKPEVKYTGNAFTARRVSISIPIVAGGPEAPYALYVHEDLDAFHKVGQAKFIESVLRESQSHLGPRIARRIDLKKAL